MDDECLATDAQIQYDWERHIMKMMITAGWTCDINNEEKLGFCWYKEGQQRQIRDYDKKTKTFVQFDPDQKINLVSTKVSNEQQTEPV